MLKLLLLAASLSEGATFRQPAFQRHQQQEEPALLHDLAIGGNRNLRSYALSGVRRQAYAGGRVLLGMGARATFLTGALELHPARKDFGESRLSVDSARLFMMNATVHGAVRATRALEAGFNLDVAGASVGLGEDAHYRTSPYDEAVRVRARPSTGNLFLFGSNDKGSLNSEFYLGYRLNEEMSVRGGLSHLLSEYSTYQDTPSATRRFRRFNNLVFLAVRWIPK